MSSTRLEGFEYSRRRIGDCDYLLAEIGAGPVVLLLHGFPETHVCWEEVGRKLAASHRVLLCDLRGYGGSSAPAGGARGEGFTKREMAAELAQLMSELGHETFAVVGHDRGARVAHRLALDHPRRVSRLGLVNILPTVSQFARMGAGASLGFWPWYFLAQPAPFPERLIEADPETMLNHIFATWPSSPEAIGPDHRAAYLEAMTPDVIAAICADYRASFHLDQQHDIEDRQLGRRISAPTLVVVGKDEEQLADAYEIWDDWVEELSYKQVPGGHFLPEEAPQELAHAVREFLLRERDPQHT